MSVHFFSHENSTELPETHPEFFLVLVCCRSDQWLRPEQLNRAIRVGTENPLDTPTDTQKLCRSDIVVIWDVAPFSRRSDDGGTKHPRNTRLHGDNLSSQLFVCLSQNPVSFAIQTLIDPYTILFTRFSSCTPSKKVTSSVKFCQKSRPCHSPRIHERNIWRLI